ncbi:lysozyme inhibitor LprI family protein [uncultured Rhodoblastus sp.]|uniref:lysozyme inhibitor LprI family protein n=1 Tax=uncultured Rhodoblastus sp. TaxID=543037 RepID=UPI0025D65CC9|nr:lysozyme inhibitor LprI family protein [uncultured Rhodoblastus sp.]
MKVLGLLVLFIALPASVAQSASFNCAKAKTPLEVKICREPALGKADEALAKVYQQRLRDFPIPTFIKDSQRAWLSMTQQCPQFEASNSGDTCLGLYRARIDALNHYGNAKIYTDYGKAFSHEQTTLLLYEKNGGLWLDWYGDWMPDAYRPKPFPDGYLAQDGGALTAKDGKYAIADHDDATVTVTDDKITFGGEYGMSLSARQGFLHGDYPRVK